MKSYRIVITNKAFSQIEAVFHTIQKQSFQNADQWLNKLYDKVNSLTTMPERFGVVRENELFDIEIRCLRHFSHRILYTVDCELLVVNVHAVLHGSKDDLTGSEY